MKRVLFTSIFLFVAFAIVGAQASSFFPFLDIHGMANTLGHGIITAGTALAFAAVSPIQLSPARAKSNLPETPGRPAAPAEQVGNLSQAISDLAAATSNSTLVDRGALKQLIPNPTNTTYIVNNLAGMGAAPVVAYMFNEDYLNATPDDNGSGPGSVEKSYNDGFSGNLINRIIGSKGDAGLAVKQLQIEMTVNATGLQSTSAVKNASPTVTAYNGDLSSLPQNIPLGTTSSPMYLQAGFLIINVAFVIQRFAQMSFNVPVGITATVTIVYGS